MAEQALLGEIPNEEIPHIELDDGSAHFSSRKTPLALHLALADEIKIEDLINFLAMGADPNQVDGLSNSALHYLTGNAAIPGAIEGIKFLLEKGYSPHIRNAHPSQNTPLSYALLDPVKNLEAAFILFENGATITMEDNIMVHNALKGSNASCKLLLAYMQVKLLTNSPLKILTAHTLCDHLQRAFELEAEEIPDILKERYVEDLATKITKKLDSSDKCLTAWQEEQIARRIIEVLPTAIEKLTKKPGFEFLEPLAKLADILKARL